MLCVSVFARARGKSFDMCAWEGMLFGVCVCVCARAPACGHRTHHA